MAYESCGRAETDHVIVSTVFFGIDLNLGVGPPLLFETIVFNGARHGEQEHYATLDDAKA